MLQTRHEKNGPKREKARTGTLHRKGVGVGRWGGGVGATSSHLLQKYTHTHTRTQRAHLPGRNIPGETRDAALAAVRVREM